MRISINKNDPGFRHGLDVTMVKVYLDGELYQGAITADEEKGEILTYVMDQHGKIVASEDGKSAQVKTIYGRVRIDLVAADGSDQRVPKVSVERNAEGEIEVLVYSRMRARQVRRHTINVESLQKLSDDKLATQCGIMAGAGAEYCCENHGDVFDPSEAARIGKELYKQLMAGELEIIRH